MKKPKIICICGSTRFGDLHAVKKWDFESSGKAICLMINILPYWYCEVQGWDKLDHIGEQAGLRDILDELHFRKIDLCDELFIINYKGYIGESTRNEINYAKRIGKPVKYMEKTRDEADKT